MTERELQDVTERYLATLDTFDTSLGTLDTDLWYARYATYDTLLSALSTHYI